MAENTSISWTDATFNPWWGCQKISPACDHCYAERDAKRFVPGRVLWGVDSERRTFGDAHWDAPRKWAKTMPQKLGRRPRVFCSSMADVFDKEAPAGARERLWRLIWETPQLDWLLLTKRIGNALRMLPEDWLGVYGFAGKPKRWPANLRVGATFCNQQEVNRDMHKLLGLGCPNFCSLEPLLGPIDLAHIDRESPDGDWTYRDNALTGFQANKSGGYDGKRLDWVIAGGESGHGARPMHPDWVRSLQQQCAGAGVPFHFKQWGEWTPGENVERVRGTVDTAFWDDGWSVYPLNLVTDHGHVDDQPDLYRIGKKAAGRLLDGRTHDEFPPCPT